MFLTNVTIAAVNYTFAGVGLVDIRQQCAPDGNSAIKKARCCRRALNQWADHPVALVVNLGREARRPHPAIVDVKELAGSSWR